MHKLIIFLMSLLFTLQLSAQIQPPPVPTAPPGPLCPLPNLAKCQEGGYLSGPCGKLHLTVCDNLIKNSFKTELSSMSQSEDPRLGNGNATNIKSQNVDYSDFTLTGMDSNPQAYVYRNQLLSIKPSNKLTPAEFLWLLAKEGWEKNGNKIESCHEYAYERFYDLAKHENEIAKLMHKDRKIYDYVMQNKVIQNGLKSKDGAGFAVAFPSGRQPKNKYFKYTLNFWYPNPKDAFKFEQGLLMTILQGREYAYHHWAHHEAMGEIFPSTQDSVLTSHFKKQDDYENLILSRDEVQKRWTASAFALYNRMFRQGNSPSEIEVALQFHNAPFNAELYSIDQKIQNTLIEARNLGCLDLTKNTVCDWSPALFVNELKAAIALMRDNEYKRCMTLTSNNFAPDSRVVLRRGDISSTALDRYLTEYNAALANLPFTPNPATGKPLVGEEHSDQSSSGNKYFGIGYNYASGWNVGNFQKPTEQTCDATMGLNTSFNGYVKLFGEKLNVIEARGDIGTRKIPLNPTQREVHAGLSVKVLGNDLLTPIDESQNVSFSVQKDDLFLSQEASVSSYIVVVAIPIKLSVGMSGKLGVKVAVGADFARDCARNALIMSLGGAVTPFVNLTGFASASVDLAAVEIGVRGELVLIDLSLPFSVTGSIKPVGSELLLATNTSLDLVVKSLAGRVLLFVDYTVDEAHVTILNWKGKKTTFPLLRNKPIKDVSLSIIKAQQ